MTSISETIPTAEDRWRLAFVPEVPASQRASASCYRRPEDIDVFAVVIPELKFRDVQRQILAADLVECADHAALEDARKERERRRSPCIGLARTATATEL